MAGWVIPIAPFKIKTTIPRLFWENAMTANAMQGDRERCIDAGMDDYLSKPLDPARLRAAVEQWAPAVEPN